MLQLLSQLPLYVSLLVTLLVASGVCMLIALATGGTPAACVFATYGGIVTVLLHFCCFQ